MAEHEESGIVNDETQHAPMLVWFLCPNCQHEIDLGDA